MLSLPKCGSFSGNSSSYRLAFSPWLWVGIASRHVGLYYLFFCCCASWRLLITESETRSWLRHYREDLLHVATAHIATDTGQGETQKPPSEAAANTLDRIESAADVALLMGEMFRGAGLKLVRHLIIIVVVPYLSNFPCNRFISRGTNVHWT